MLALASVLLNAAAGFCIFLFALLGRLLLVPDGALKRCVIYGLLALSVLGPAYLGALYPGAPGLTIAIVTLLLTLAAECVKLSLGRMWRGSPPIGSVAHRVPLAKPVTTTDLQIHRFEITIPRWQGRRLRIAHLSDLHVNPDLPPEYFLDVLDAVRAEAPDLCFVTGDFISDARHLDLLAHSLRPTGKLGTFAVLGNHDFWAGADRVAAVVRAAGIDLLLNESRPLNVRGVPIRVTGSNEPWLPGFTVSPPVAGDELHLVLSHTPDNIFRLAKQRADCVFAGHCHAGQFRLPHFGSVLVPSVYGRLFDHGHFKVRGSHLFVSSGVGAASPAVRIYCQPDIFIVDINP
jgi:predicted MPP superfamily phosphohydrolase